MPLRIEPRHVPASSTPERQALSEATAQAARDRVYHRPSDSLTFPWRTAHAIVGRIRPGSLVLVGAATGQGKTTFMLNLLHQFAVANLATHFMGTEQAPADIVFKWACLVSRVPIGVAEGMEWETYHDPTAQARVADAVDHIETAYLQSDVIGFSAELFVDPRAIEQAAQQAVEARCGVLMIDHIDRVDTDGGDRDAFVAMRRLVRRLKELAREYRLVVIAASQLNRESRAGDRLAVYRPPQLHHLRGGGAKEEESDVVLGLWRPRRLPTGGETPGDLKKLTQAARAGDAEPATILEPETIGLQVLKHRADGQREGRAVHLRIRGGVISDRPARDAYRTTTFTGACDPALPAAGTAGGDAAAYEADERAGLEGGG